MLENIIRGGQISIHAVRMFKQVFAVVFLCCFIVWIILFCFKVYMRIDVQQITGFADYYTAKIISEVGFPEHKFSVDISGLNAVEKAENVLKSYYFNKKKDHVEAVLLDSGKVASFYSLFLFAIFSFYFIYMGFTKSGEQFLRGAKFNDFKKLKKRIKRSNFLSLYKGHSIVGMPYPKLAEAQHTLIIGSTGTGKTVAISDLIEQIRGRGERAIIYDKKCDYISYFYDEKKDFILNPFDKRSENWKLLSEIQHVAQIKTIAQSFIPDASSGSESKIWNEAARIAFSGILEKLISIDPSLSNAEIANKILKQDLKDVAKLLQGTHAKSTLDMSSPKTAASVMFVLSSHLNSLRFASNNNKKNFSIRDWMRAEKDDSFLFISSQEDFKAELMPLQTAWFEIVIGSLLSVKSEKQSNKKTWVIIDELAGMNKIPSLSGGLSVARSYGGCFVIGTQNIAQIREIYGRNTAQDISSECNTRCIFRSNDPETAKWLSENIGDTETREYKEGLSYGAHAMRDGINLNINERSKNLVMPSEIQNLADLHLFLKLPGHSFVRTSLEYKARKEEAEGFIQNDEMIVGLKCDYEKENKDTDTEDVDFKAKLETDPVSAASSADGSLHQSERKRKSEKSKEKSLNNVVEW